MNTSTSTYPDNGHATQVANDTRDLEASMSLMQKWMRLLRLASTGSLPTASSPFPEGTLNPSVNMTGDIHGVRTIRWKYAPTDAPAAVVMIMLMVYPSLRDALAGYAVRSEKAAKEGKSVRLWPEGFPNRSDYECVEACCLLGSAASMEETAAVSEEEAEVVWVQRSPVVASMLVDEEEDDDDGDGADEKDDEDALAKTTVKQEEGKGACYVVSLRGGDVSVLKDMADGVWGAVFEGSVKA